MLAKPNFRGISWYPISDAIESGSCPRSDVSKFYSTMADAFYQGPVGLDEVSATGLLAQQYMGTHSIAREDLAEVAAMA